MTAATRRQNRGPWFGSCRWASSCHDVVDDLGRLEHQLPVEGDDVRAAVADAPAARAEVADHDAGGGRAYERRVVGDARADPRPRVLRVPAHEGGARLAVQAAREFEAAATQGDRRAGQLRGVDEREPVRAAEVREPLAVHKARPRWGRAERLELGELAEHPWELGAYGALELASRDARGRPGSQARE